MSNILTAYPTAESAASKASRRLIIAASLGNVFESFDLYIFGIMASTIAKLYFPAASDAASLLIFLSTFGVTFFVRPLGAVYLGNLADKIGRARVMSLSLLLMTVGMLIVAVTPTFATIGIAAPIAVVIGRVLQGFSAGGEFGSATALLAEHHPQRRGFITSWQAATQGFALMSAAATGAFLTASLSAAQFDSWGWRLPFLFGALLGPVGLYLRRHTEESSEFNEHANGEPIVELFKSQKSRVMTGIGLIALATIMIWMSVFLPTYAIRQFHMNPTIAFFWCCGQWRNGLRAFAFRRADFGLCRPHCTDACRHDRGGASRVSGICNDEDLADARDVDHLQRNFWHDHRVIFRPDSRADV
ncbi:MFS transporter [Paraburkholderia agricolaris]|uniref:MFS transporter n=1 Tax=Paraburkholderia agricolaris TaxID=2152888 RepID=UPI00142EE34D|nr:MFS transporter [Paraburkholderia agricolaris]